MKARESNDHQLAILALAKAKGLDANNLTPSQYQLLAVMVRSPGQLLRDGKNLVESYTATGLNLRVVPDEVAAGNEATCRKNECGKFRELKSRDGDIVPACDACNCSGRKLLSRWRDKKWYCPKGYWDNRLVRAVKKLIGDSSTKEVSGGP